jgi:outer membrane protease
MTTRAELLALAKGQNNPALDVLVSAAELLAIEMATENASLQLVAANNSAIFNLPDIGMAGSQAHAALYHATRMSTAGSRLDENLFNIAAILEKLGVEVNW